MVLKIEESTPTKHVAIMKERESDQHANAVVEIDPPAAGHRVVRGDTTSGEVAAT